MSAIKMQVQKREEIGKNSIKQLRKDNLIPAVIYSKGKETTHVSVNEVEFLRVYKLAGTTSLINLDLEGKSVPVIIKDVQRHPFKNQVLHLDLQELNMDEKIKITVPIVLLNRDNILLQPSVLMQILDQVEVECLPGNMPSTAEVDVQNMDFTTPIMVKDLDIAKDENITVLRDLEDVVCTLSQPAAPAEGEEEETDIPEATEASESQME